MIKYVIIILVALSVIETSGQEFESKFNSILADSITYNTVRWADFDNDSLLDVFVSGKSNAGGTFFSIYKNSVTSGPTHKVFLNTKFQSSAFAILDFDSDNQMDIILTGMESGLPQTAVFINQGGFVFQRNAVIAIAGSVVDMADLNVDGKLELIISGSDLSGPFFNIYTGALANWSLANDEIKIDAQSVQVMDFNEDTFNDIFISGMNAGGKPVSVLYSNINDGIKFIALHSLKLAGATSVSDLDNDGGFDVLISGKDSVMNPHTVMALSRCKNCLETKPILSLTNAKIFSGDFNSDGKCDVNLFGLTPTNELINLFRHQDETYDTISAVDIQDQSFGDFDRDGDLDLLQLKSKNGITDLVISSNETIPQNLAPQSPKNPVAVKIFNRLFMYWDKQPDDHTNIESLTFDVTIKSPGKEILSGTFDQLNENRLLVNHGNTGGANYLCLKTNVDNGFTFNIQAVDNAYHAGGSSVCTGSGSSECIKIVNRKIESCVGKTIELASSEISFWYSFSDGAIGMSSAINFPLEAMDTVFSLVPSAAPGCSQLTIYTVSPSLNGITLEPARYVCEGSKIELKGGEGWEQVQWSSTKKGFISNQNAILFTAIENDTVTLDLGNGAGCTSKVIIPIKIDISKLVLESDAYQILRGESVQLKAEGGISYLWTPSTGLDNDTIANPVANPVKTIEYTVNMKDSVGCGDTGKVLVIVEETAFIPNLFTPNGDGKNDDLKAYGLETVSNFSFSIYNREGSLVYTTNSTTELSNNGWDGTSHGAKQPAGVYYWKVKGKNNIGRNLLLNGKTMGSIVLIR
jgi:gliding motility-associated-like protein